MKNYITSSYHFLKSVLIDDLLDRYLLVSTFFIFLIDYLVWHFYLAKDNLFVFLRIDIYPVKYLFVIIIVNIILMISAHDNEKEVGYLLLLGNIVASILIFILELFYLTHLPAS